MRNIIYTIERDSSSHQYNHVYLNVYTRASLDHYACTPVLKFSWQGDSNSDHWYAFKAKAKTESASAGIAQFRLAASILGLLQDINTDDIGAVVKALDCERLVEDRRVHQWLPVEEVKPATWQRYMSWVDGSCQCAAIAPNEEHAVKALIKEYARNMESGYGNYADKLASWIKDGSPVRVDEWAKAPDTTPLEDIIKPMKIPAIPTPVVSDNLVNAVA